MIEDDMIADEARRRGLSPTQLKMLKATPDSLMRDLAQDARRSSAPSSMIPPKPVAPVVRGNGWVDQTPLTLPAGIGIIDRMVDAQDALDRRQRERDWGVR